MAVKIQRKALSIHLLMLHGVLLFTFGQLCYINLYANGKLSARSLSPSRLGGFIRLLSSTHLKDPGLRYLSSSRENMSKHLSARNSHQGQAIKPFLRSANSVRILPNELLDPKTIVKASLSVANDNGTVPATIPTLEEGVEPLKGAQYISSLTASSPKPFYSHDDIKEILPHRFPFLLVDSVLEFEPGKRAVGIKQISGNEDQFNGHFPHKAIFPGVLQIEAMAQLGGIVCLLPPINNGEKADFLFAGVNGVKWKKPVLPGDTLVMEVELTFWRPTFGIAKMKGKGFVNGEPAIEIQELTFAVVKNKA